MCECDSNRSMDMKTPRNVYLSAFYKRSFAFHTVKNRMPIILTSLIDNLVRNKNKIAEEYGKDAKSELKKVIGELSEFKYEIQTNKHLKKLASTAPDAELYNHYIDKQSTEEGPPTHFHTIWLLTECYMYRRISQIFKQTNTLKNFDPFRAQKEESFRSAFPLIIQFGEFLLEILQDNKPADKTTFIQMLKLNLWGNKCDLSISLGRVSSQLTLFDVATLDKHILSNHDKNIWKAVSETSGSNIIDIVFDNAGYEVFTDLCIADYLVTKNLCKIVRLYVKNIPWFISDVMTHDFHWTIDHLKNNKDYPDLRALGSRWSKYVQNGTWQIVESDFWTLPFDYSQMAKIDPDLYKKLSEAKIAIFKGDLNYRKLFGEMNWNPTTAIDVALQGFNPTKLVILRTIKADIVCGLDEGVAEKIEAQDPKWMETGEWGLIQFSDKIVKID